MLRTTGDTVPPLLHSRKTHYVCVTHAYQQVPYVAPAGWYKASYAAVHAHTYGQFVLGNCILACWTQATQDTMYLDAGVAIIEALYDLNWVDGGWASVQSVHTRKLEDHMPSYFLAEACKYLFLLFDDSFLQVRQNRTCHLQALANDTATRRLSRTPCNRYQRMFCRVVTCGLQ